MGATFVMASVRVGLGVFAFCEPKMRFMALLYACRQVGFVMDVAKLISGQAGQAAVDSRKFGRLGFSEELSRANFS